jgi:hypothetical protein
MKKSFVAAGGTLQSAAASSQAERAEMARAAEVLVVGSAANDPRFSFRIAAAKGHRYAAE